MLNLIIILVHLWLALISGDVQDINMNEDGAYVEYVDGSGYFVEL